MTIAAKICGLTDKASVTAAVSGGARYIGFVFFKKSPRNVTPKQAAELSQGLPRTVKTVAVTVNASDADIEAILTEFRPDYIQCHGKETPERLREIRAKFGLKIIKALAVRSGDDVAAAGAFTDSADMLLFDAKVPAAPLPGGNGLVFDWNILHGREFLLPWFVSGGLNSDNVAEAVHISGARAVDVSSSIESAPGKKDPRLIAEFLKKVQTL